MVHEAAVHLHAFELTIFSLIERAHADVPDALPFRGLSGLPTRADFADFAGFTALADRADLPVFFVTLSSLTRAISRIIRSLQPVIFSAIWRCFFDTEGGPEMLIGLLGNV